MVPLPGNDACRVSVARVTIRPEPERTRARCAQPADRSHAGQDPVHEGAHDLVRVFPTRDPRGRLDGGGVEMKALTVRWAAGCAAVGSSALGAGALALA